MAPRPPLVPRFADDETDWMPRGACRRHDPDLWYPPKSGQQYSRAAVAICLHHCHVVVECRAYALSHQEAHGIWGGLTEQEREDIRRNKPRKSLLQKGIHM